MQNLDRDLPVVLQVSGDEDGGHTPSAHFGLDGVSLSKRRVQPVDQIRHSAS